MRIKKSVCFFLATFFLVLCFTGYGTVLAAKETVEINKETKISELSGKNIGVLTASVQAIVMPEIVPDAVFYEFNTHADMIAALLNDKLDALSIDESSYKSMLWEGQKVERLDETVLPSEYGMIFPKGKNQKLRDEFNEYLANIRADGRHKALSDKWFADSEPTELIDCDNLPGENGTISVGISASSRPFVYTKNNKYTGFEIELLTGFCLEYGYSLKFEDTSFVGIIAGISVGKYDMGMSGITISEERKESVDFSDPIHSEELVVAIKPHKKEKILQPSGDLSQFENAELGIVTGSLYDGYTKKQFPDATIKEFNNFADLLVALKQKKVSGIMLDRPNYNSVSRVETSLEAINVPAFSVEVGFGFQKNEEGNLLSSQMNELLKKLKAEGKIDKLIEKWYGNEEPEELIPLWELEENRKLLNVCVDTTRKPFVYMYEGQPVGFEIEMLYLFCKEYGYNVKTSDVSFASGLAGLASEKYDMVCGGLYMTPERKKSVNFSEPYMFADVVMAKYRETGLGDFVLSMRESFDKTFIREHRWKLILEGIDTTMWISAFSVIGGTLLGFGLYMLTRSKRKWISRISKCVASVHSIIIAGTPTLVVLMLLFYLVFTSPKISATFVAIVGFVLTFGAFVYSNLAVAVTSVDNGQKEAAYALGYSKNGAFFKIILPQAMKIFIPGYTGEIISLIKATSVVGYIAVNDLTKMGDIIRGNTYEAFFPLIAVALIYFVIIWIITGLLGILKKKTEPKKRKDKNILKGVIR